MRTINQYKRSVIALLILLLIIQGAIAQQHKDTLQWCKQLKEAGNIKDSYSLLKDYLHHQPKDFNALWFTAKLAYWNYEIEPAEQFYQSAIALQPKNLYLKLDYSMMLVEIAKFEGAIPLLKEYLKYDSLSKDAQIYLAKAYYWQGMTSEGLAVLNKVPATIQNNNSIKALRKEIKLVRATNLTIKGGYNFDDQPLHDIVAGIQFSKNNSNLCNWSIAGNSHSFSNDSLNNKAYELHVGNKFTFYNAGMQINAQAGIVSLPFASSTDFTGAIGITKKIVNGISLLVEAEKKPYFSTISSTQTKVMQTVVTAAINIDNLKAFTGRIQYQQQMFDGANVNSFSAWALTPAVKWKKLSAKAGYSYQMSDANNNTYTATMTLDSIRKYYPTSVNIPAVYTPYFTPKSQTIHSLLLWFNYQPTGKLSFTATGSIPLYASLSNPYLFLNTNTTNNTILSKSYTTQTYSPIDFHFNMQYHISERISAKAGYAYLKTSYYSGQFIDASLNILLLHE